MALVLDTNAFSALADGDATLRKAIAREPDLALRVIVLGEHLFGLRNSRFRSRYESWLDTYLTHFAVLQIGLRTAESYAEFARNFGRRAGPFPPTMCGLRRLLANTGTA
jgi:predicted nucleic acid-binding protein